MGNTDNLKGRVKEAAGDVTGNKDMKREGKVDQFTGDVKEKVEQASDKVKEKLHRD